MVPFAAQEIARPLLGHLGTRASACCPLSHSRPRKTASPATAGAVKSSRVVRAVVMVVALITGYLRHSAASVRTSCVNAGAPAFSALADPFACSPCSGKPETRGVAVRCDRACRTRLFGPQRGCAPSDRGATLGRRGSRTAGSTMRCARLAHLGWLVRWGASPRASGLSDSHHAQAIAAMTAEAASAFSPGDVRGRRAGCRPTTRHTISI